MEFGQAMKILRKGGAVRQGERGVILTLQKGRKIEATFGPSVGVVGKGNSFKSYDHFCAWYSVHGDEPACEVGYQPTPDDLSASNWEVFAEPPVGVRASDGRPHDPYNGQREVGT